MIFGFLHSRNEIILAKAINDKSILFKFIYDSHKLYSVDASK